MSQGLSGPQHQSSSLKKVHPKRLCGIFPEAQPALALGYGLDEDLVFKIFEMTESIMELYHIVGLPLVRSKSWFEYRNYKKEAGCHPDAIKALRSNRVKYHFIHVLCAYVSLNGQDSWVKLLKWKFASYFAHVRKQDIPAKPPGVNLVLGTNPFGIEDLEKSLSKLYNPTLILGGGANRFILKLRSSNYELYMQFVNSTLQLKKGMPCVSEEMCAQSVKDTIAALTTLEPRAVPEILIWKKCVERPNVDPPIFQRPIVVDDDWDWDKFTFAERVFMSPIMDQAFQLNKNIVIEQIRRTVTELFEGQSFGDEFFKPFFPSTSANYMRSRTKCGGLGEIYDAPLTNPLGTNGDCLDLGSEAVVLTNEIPKSFGVRGAYEAEAIRQNEVLGYDNQEPAVCNVVDTTPIDECWKKQFHELFIMALKEKPRVKAIPLKEELKCRVITAGPPLTYTVLKPLQAFLWKILKNNKVFSLIGRYVTPEDIERCARGMKEDEYLISGDYKASTDNLRSWVSEAALDQLMIEIGEAIPAELLAQLPDHFLDNLKELCVRALTKHLFIDLEDPDVTEKPQTEGQLMGSIISFPFLCIANAAMCRYAMELAGGCIYRVRDLPFKGCGPLAPLLINGDDCLLRIKKLLGRKLWEAVTRIGGLETSIGKTYFSDTFCTINSTIFENRDGIWTEAKYVNLGLMVGASRVAVQNKLELSFKKKRLQEMMNRNQADKKKGLKLTFTEKRLSDIRHDILTRHPDIQVHQMGNISRELKRSCPEILWPVVKRRFIYFNARILKSAEGIPWFIPEWLGGLGLPCDSESERDEITRKCCSLIKAKLAKNDKKFLVASPDKFDSWGMHKLVMAYMREHKFVEPVSYKTMTTSDGVVRDIEAEYAMVYKYVTLNLLQERKLDDLVLDVDRNYRSALRNNSSLWSKCRKEVSKCSISPMGDADILFENKKLTSPVYVRSFGERSDLIL